MSGSYSSNKSQQASTTQDNKIVLDGGGLALAGGTLSLGNGASVNITSSDPDVATTALNLAKDITTNVLSTASGLAAQSNTAATHVVDAQGAFVGEASGQKTGTIIAGLGLLAVVGIVMLKGGN